MPFIQKVKRVVRGHYHAATARKLKLADGTYTTKYQVTHHTERCSWKQFGTPDKVAYEHWWQEACGIVSLRTIIGAIQPDNKQQPTIFAHITYAIQSGAYLENVGWKHDGLVKLAKEHGLKGYAAQLSLNAICKELTANKLVIASVYRPFTRFIDEDAERKKSGGHLVVITGFTWKDGNCTSLFVEDPYDIKQRKEPIDSQLFEDVYSGAGITLYKGSANY